MQIELSGGAARKMVWKIIILELDSNKPSYVWTLTWYT